LTNSVFGTSVLKMFKRIRIASIGKSAQVFSMLTAMEQTSPTFRLVLATSTSFLGDHGLLAACGAVVVADRSSTSPSAISSALDETVTRVTPPPLQATDGTKRIERAWLQPETWLLWS
jgi:hypothetical protein